MRVRPVCGCVDFSRLLKVASTIVSGFRLKADQRSCDAYQRSCSDQPWHRRHRVHRHRCSHPGHRPRVRNVFHVVPQPSNGSGPSASKQHHRDNRVGCQSHKGQRIRLNASSSSGLTFVSGVRSPSGARLKAQRGGGVDSDGSIMSREFYSNVIGVAFFTDHEPQRLRGSQAQRPTKKEFSVSLCLCGPWRVKGPSL
jgi:hypothetical protein